MSKYTTEIRWIVEQTEKDSTGDRPPNALYHLETYKKLGLDSFPIFDETYRYTLADKIINHYYLREIGLETVALFAWYMKQKLWEIMPWYNKMYLAVNALDDTDILTDYMRDYTEHWNVANDDTEKQQYDNTRTTDTTNTANSRSDNQNIYQDTPMSMLAESGDPNPVENLKYATNVTYDDGTIVSDSNTVGTDKHTGEDTTTKDKNEDGWRTRKETGRNKSPAALLDEYYKKMLNIDLLIIDECKDLFFALW